ncbi:MAG: peptidoglycan DD-metalloendopeptidase family protein [Candidatus Obscuribacterales bacterium]|nr:peptidoglycan DD-metalloendopeptidase family protein [Candidatus Obscuribacterales bacterium]
MFDPHNKVFKVVAWTLLLAICSSDGAAWCRSRHRGHRAAAHKAAAPKATPQKSSGQTKHFSNKTDMEAEMEALDRKREEIHARIAGARKKEKLAYAKLSEITHKLHATEGTLKNSKNKLNATENQIEKTADTINKTETAAQKHEHLAGHRLREIYEGHRLSFLEMAFQVDSLQNLLDRVYYQERIASLDRSLIDQLRARRQALEDNKSRLDHEKNKLGDIVTEIAKKAMEFAKLRVSQEQAADQLRTQRAFFEQAERELAMQSKALEKQILAMETSSENHSNKPMQRGTGSMAMPLRAKVTSPFGWRTHPIFRRRKFHTGVDLAGPRRSPIRASDSGHVLYTGWYGGYGKVVIVSHGSNLSTLYAHLSSFAVSKGQNIAKGDVVGYEGATGFATGPHLHFEVRVEGKPNNPLNYVH